MDRSLPVTQRITVSIFIFGLTASHNLHHIERSFLIPFTSFHVLVSPTTVLATTIDVFLYTSYPRDHDSVQYSNFIHIYVVNESDVDLHVQ